ncbi:MAG TPA: hypothetical protein VK395_16065 [Gemmataceae bacterium]|nr:hypothetical protein [Gemmataceae bacterium]
MKRAWCLLICFCSISCTGNPHGDHPAHPVTGRILVNGQPANNADITFYHLGDWGKETIIPMARTEEDGTFALATYAVKDGAPVGEYEVTVTWPAYRHARDIGPDKLGGKFAKRGASGLKKTIEADTKEVNFELTADLSKVKVDVPTVSGRRSGR